MRTVLYAILSAAIATFATSSVIAFATAVPTPGPELSQSEQELVAYLDARIQAQLDGIKAQLDLD